jgi:hypothetical protein
VLLLLLLVLLVLMQWYVVTAPLLCQSFLSKSCAVFVSCLHKLVLCYVRTTEGMCASANTTLKLILLYATSRYIGFVLHVMLAQKEAVNKEMMSSMSTLAKMYMQHNSMDPTAFTAELLAQLSLSDTSGDSSKDPSVAAAVTAAARKKKPTLTVNTGFGGGGVSTTGKHTTKHA